MNDSTTSHVTCNFCGKRQGQVAKIVAGAGVYTRRQAEAVLAEIADDTAGLLAEAARMPADGWHRRLRRLPGETRTATWLVRHTMHEGEHHLLDITTTAGI